MNNELGILLQAKLDLQKTVANINADLKKLATQVQVLNLNIDTSNLTKDINQQLGKINKQGKGFQLETNLDEIPNDISNVNKFVEQLKKNFNATSASIRQDAKIIENDIGELESQTKSWLVTLRQADGVTRNLRLSPTPDGKNFTPEFITVNDKSEEQSLKNLQERIALINKNREQADKLFSTEQRRTQQLEHQLEIEQRMAAIRVQDLRRRYEPVITPEQNKQLDAYVQSMKNLEASTPNVQQQIRRLNTDFKEVNANLAEAGGRSNTFVQNLTEAARRIPVWMIGMSMFYAPLRAMQDAIQQIIDLDSQMVVLERVSNGMIDVNQAMEDSIGIAERLGNTISQVNDGLIAFARQGYRGNDLTAITEVATIMGNVSDLEIEESASALTAAMKGFNIEAENSIRIVDSLNEVDKFVVPYTSDGVLQIA